MQVSIVEEIQKYVAKNIGEFHFKRIESARRVNLKKLLIKKNPYLFKTKNILTADILINTLLSSFLSSNEETIFGEWLEGLAIYVCKISYGGRKSSATGIDLEFDRDGIRYLVSIKSGPNWGNSSQVKKMTDDFKSAIKTLRTNNSKINVVAVNGCCYGTDNKPLKNENYYKFCGEEFWEFISCSPGLYKNIIEPLGTDAKVNNDNFDQELAKLKNGLIREFAFEFCTQDGSIDWNKIVELNSGRK